MGILPEYPNGKWDELTIIKVVLGSIAFGTAVTVVAFPLALISPRLTDTLLRPGYHYPLAEWGGIHDPLQLLLALGLNVACWALFGFLAIAAVIAFSGPRK